METTDGEIILMETNTSNTVTPPTMRIHECSDGRQRNDEQYAEYKKKNELFSKHPEQFIHVDELVIGAIKAEHGIGVIIGKCVRGDMELALTRINYRAFSLFQQMEIRQMMEAESEKKIVTAPGAVPTTPGGIII